MNLVLKTEWKFFAGSKRRRNFVIKSMWRKNVIKEEINKKHSKFIKKRNIKHYFYEYFVIRFRFSSSFGSFLYCLFASDQLSILCFVMAFTRFSLQCNIYENFYSNVPSHSVIKLWIELHLNISDPLIHPMRVFDR